MIDRVVEFTQETSSPPAARWGAVFSLSLCVVGFIVAELLPASLLSPMATDLGVSEGAAGQAVTTTSLVAFFSSLFVSAATRGVDRRTILLCLAALLVLSNLLVAIASNFPMMLAGRMLLGIGLGGFWAMAASITMRLVPEPMVPRALSIVYGGLSVGMIAAIPLGAYLADVVGWRAVFVGTALLASVALVWQALTLPAIPPTSISRVSVLVQLLRRPQVSVGLIGMVLVFGAHFTFLTYLRPFLERVTDLGGNGIAVIFLGFGLANILGTGLSGLVISKSLRIAITATPAVMAILATGFVAFGHHPIMAATIVVAWGITYGFVPVAWATWGTRTAPDEAESAGGLQIAVIQMSITAGAGIGGILLDAFGPMSPFMGACTVAILSTTLIAMRLRPPRGDTLGPAH